MNQPILHLVPDLIGPPGGIARFCRMVCHALLEAGEELEVVALCDVASSKASANYEFPKMSYQPTQGTRLKFVYTALLAALRQRPKVILVGHVNFAPLGWLLAKVIRCPYIVFIHGIDVWDPLPLPRRWALAQANQIISVSQFSAVRAEQSNGISPQKVRILPNCLDPQFEYPPQRGNKTTKLSMLTVARLSLAHQNKGHDYVIRAIPTLLAQFPELTYDIVGDGDGRSILEELAATTGVKQAVHFHGAISDEELQQHYADAALFVMPSRGEGFGIVFLEAMAHGLPILAGNLDATPEVILEGQTGLLVDPTCVDAIANAATRLLSDCELRNRMGQAGIAHVAQNYRYDQFRQRLLSYLSELDGLRPHIQMA